MGNIKHMSLFRTMSDLSVSSMERWAKPGQFFFYFNLKNSDPPFQQPRLQEHQNKQAPD